MTSQWRLVEDRQEGKLEMPKKRMSKKREAPSSEVFIHGQVQSWHVLMVSHDRLIEVPRDRAQYEEKQRDGGMRYTRRTVSDHLGLELALLLRQPVRNHSELQLSINEWEAEEFGGISGDLRYDKEMGMQGHLYLSGDFPRNLYLLLLSGASVAMAIETVNGFCRRKAWVKSLAFSDAGHPQWIDEESSLI